VDHKNFCVARHPLDRWLLFVDGSCLGGWPQGALTTDVRDRSSNKGPCVIACMYPYILIRRPVCSGPDAME
jgi:hypothetical protein